ncbi:MAG: universal stress protein [Daejeonella sp.]|uniref:universal stress protein n=1 Tax=Daejeonella sp. TaxID=2805397 RepID=UPI0027330E4A|nr:universal stress protein [Daejeonella sp.]MDP3467311.1 universal stress protein [Daejeonella sp.]
MIKLLIPTDFSDNALKAVEYVMEIAKISETTIYLLNVIEPIPNSIRQPYAGLEKLEKEIVNNRLSELNALQKSIVQQYPDIKIESEVVRGTIITSVLDFAESKQVDLIVMGTKGATGLQEIFMGSVSAGTIGQSKIPVLTIPHDYIFEVPDGILFATNRFEENTELLNKIVEIANLFSASIHVVVFVDTDTAEAADYIQNTRQLTNYLVFLKTAFPGITFKAELLEGSVFEEIIENYNTKNEVDIIAMITYPKSFWERLVKKSMTKKMAFHSKIPVLAIPAK